MYERKSKFGNERERGGGKRAKHLCDRVYAAREEKKETPQRKGGRCVVRMREKQTKKKRKKKGRRTEGQMRWTVCIAKRMQHKQK